MVGVDTSIAAVRSELAAVLGLTGDAIVSHTPSGWISGWNPAATKLFGYGVEEMIGTDIDRLVPPERRGSEAEIRRRVVSGQQVGRHDTVWLHSDGSRVPVSQVLTAVLNSDGATAGVVVLSSRGEPDDGGPPPQGGSRMVEVHAQNALLQAQLQQAQRLEALGQLAGGVAHDFNNLLTVILNCASFAMEELSSPHPEVAQWERLCHPAMQDVAQIEQAAGRAARLTRQLLTFARREVVQPRVLDLCHSITDVKDILRRTLGAEVELVTSLPGHRWPILADPGQIEQVLVNLAVNARDAMPDGGTLHIDTANVEVDADAVAGGSPVPVGRYVRMRVSDTGTGMPADVAARAFEPFFTTKADDGGTGLGLATVYGIVTAVGGAISIRSEPGSGTLFTIMIPATEEDAQPHETPGPEEVYAGTATVLLVEDEDALREITERILTRNGYQVLSAASGHEAFVLAGSYERDIHLLVTDVVMPKMLGREVARRITRLRPEIRVLYMSGYAQPVLASQGRLEPGVTLVTKPFSAASLLAKAAEVLTAACAPALGPPVSGQPRPPGLRPAG